MAIINWGYSGWRLFFAISAVWNFSGAIHALLFPESNLQLFYGVVTGDYYTIFLNRGVWSAVLLFGMGYAIVAYDPGRNLGIIIMGIMGKIIVAICWFYLFSVDRATGYAVFGAAGDSLFTALFIFYLVQGPRGPENFCEQGGA
jgi:hypothetical protein